MQATCGDAAAMSGFAAQSGHTAWAYFASGAPNDLNTGKRWLVESCPKIGDVPKSAALK